MDKKIYKQALTLAVPMMIQNGITNMVGLIDNVMVGNLGTEAVTGVSIAGQLIFVFNLAIFGGISGPGIYGAQYSGQKNTEGLKNTFRLKLWICGFCLLLGTAIFLFGNELLIGLYLKGDSQSVNPVLTMQYAKEYLLIMLLGLPAFALTQVYASSLRETGDSVKPMIAGITSVIVDVIFNYMLIFGNFGMSKLDVKGAAIATVLARYAEMLVVIIWATSRKDKHTFLKGIYKTLLVPKDISTVILRKGLPIFFNELLWSGGLAAVTQCYSIKGLDVIAGLNISNSICNLLNVVFVALGSSVGILIGQTLGASEYEKAEKDAFSLMKFTGLVCIGLTAILVAISGVFPKFYETTETIRNYGTNFIIITALFFPVQGFLNSLYFTIRSGGKTLITFVFDSVFSWVITLPLALLLCNFTNLSVFAVYTIVQSADIIKVVVGYILIKKGIWISNIVETSY